MARHRCGFDEIARKALMDMYKMVREPDRKVDYVIERRREE